MHPFGGLPENLVAFCAVLRSEHDFRIGPGEARDAARALEVVDLSDERAVRDALRPILCGTRRDAAVFDRAFADFVHPGPTATGQEDAQPIRGEPGGDGGGSDPPVERERRSRPPGFHEDEEDAPDARPGAAEPLAAPEDDGEGAARQMHTSRGRLEAASASAPDLAHGDAAWRDAARSLVRRVEVGLSRRWRPARSGRRFDLRRTLRASLETGGEALRPRWLRRPRRAPRFVLLVDGSRSMSAHAAVALQIAAALAGATSRIEVFTFSTALQRVTGNVRRAAAGDRRPLEALPSAWGGGTDIGGCLTEFLRVPGARLLGRDTVVIIASDGLDAGDAATLAAAMGELRRRSAAIVWLNPLLDLPGYEPIAQGMRAARPHVTTFVSVTGLESFTRLARVVRVRA
jgi:uncharacterized protein with von Willebrand factor type A (vWA) domain